MKGYGKGSIVRLSTRHLNTVSTYHTWVDSLLFLSLENLVYLPWVPTKVGGSPNYLIDSSNPRL